MQSELLSSLKEQSTLRLIGLGLITYGVYWAHYIKRQTERMNEYVDSRDGISMTFVNLFLVWSYISLGFFIAYQFVEEGHPIEAISAVADLFWSIWMLIWGFMARNIMNQALMLRIGDRFKGLWTFFFTPYYFNYKVNSLYDAEARQEEDIYNCPQCSRDVREGLKVCRLCNSPLDQKDTDSHNPT